MNLYEIAKKILDEINIRNDKIIITNYFVMEKTIYLKTTRYNQWELDDMLWVIRYYRTFTDLALKEILFDVDTIIVRFAEPKNLSLEEIVEEIIKDIEDLRESYVLCTKIIKKEKSNYLNKDCYKLTLNYPFTIKMDIMETIVQLVKRAEQYYECHIVFELYDKYAIVYIYK